MGKLNFQIGEATVKDFFAFINERHKIYLRRSKGNNKPWTKDPILRKFKFTNVFRQLDRGTVALTRCLAENQTAPHDLILFCVIWYRYFNHVDNLAEIGFCTSFEQLNNGMRRRWDRHEKIFTSAHMTTGEAFTDKIDTYLSACHIAWNRKEVLLDKIMREPASIENSFNVLRELPMVGGFVGYEMATDLRWTPLLQNAEDTHSWANVGPGAARGLRRLGMEPTCESMIQLLEIAYEYLGNHLIKHYWEGINGICKTAVEWLDHPQYPPFELREIEHCLCEFDKYRRAVTGCGRPRQLYPGE